MTSICKIETPAEDIDKGVDETNRETIMDSLFEKCTSLKELICSNEFIREKYDNRNNKNSQNLLKFGYYYFK